MRGNPIRFVILRTIDGIEMEALEREENELREIIIDTAISLLPEPKFFKKNFTTDEIEKAIRAAWDKAIYDFKRETIYFK